MRDSNHVKYKMQKLVHMEMHIYILFKRFQKISHYIIYNL